MDYIQRNLTRKLEGIIKSFSAVYLSGARQCGKSTLVQNILPPDKVNYLTFDTNSLRISAQKDPEDFIETLPKDKLNIIDEVQRIPEVYLLLKKDIDKKRFYGQGKSLFLLTGSSNIFALPELKKAMAGRIAILTLYPFSSAEITGSKKNFIESLWNEKFSIKTYKRVNVPELIKSATFPEIALDHNKDRGVWMDSYLQTIMERDAFEFAKIRKTDFIYHLLASIASRVGSLLKDDNIMKETGLNQGTYTKYKAFCNAAFLTFEIQPWAKPNRLNKRFVKSKKIYFTDTNFLCFTMRRDISDVYEKDPTLMGHLFENFIATEIMKNTSELPGKYFVSHFNPVRDDGNETDFVIENDKGESVAIDVKLNSTLSDKDFKNLELCRDTIGNKFKKGIVLYTGEELVPFGDKLWAMPVNYLWDAQ
jgi:predicted AAA+ superfamily ATPase